MIQLNFLFGNRLSKLRLGLPLLRFFTIEISWTLLLCILLCILLYCLTNQRYFVSQNWLGNFFIIFLNSILITFWTGLIFLLLRFRILLLRWSNCQRKIFTLISSYYIFYGYIICYSSWLIGLSIIHMCINFFKSQLSKLLIKMNSRKR